MPKLVYRSCWSKIQPLQYSDDSSNEYVNNFINKIFKTRTKRLVLKGVKWYYCPSDEYKTYVISIKKSRTYGKSDNIRHRNT